MGIQDLFIPASLSPLMAEAIRFKSIENQLTGKNELIVPESFLVEVFLHLGAIQMKNEGKNESNDPKSEENEEESKLIDLSNDNQLDESILPKELLDIKHRSGENILRAIFEWKNLSLKEVAERYGGNSASANLANYLARPDLELAVMRRSTALKIAQAMEVPPELVLRYLGIGV